MCKMNTKFYSLKNLVWFCWNRMNQAEPASHVFCIFIVPILLGVTVFTTLLLPPEFWVSSLDWLPLLPDSLQSKPANTKHHQWRRTQEKGGCPASECSHLTAPRSWPQAVQIPRRWAECRSGRSTFFHRSHRMYLWTSDSCKVVIKH